MGTHQDTVQRAIILSITVVRTLLDGAFNALVRMTVHNLFLLVLNYIGSMRYDKKDIRSVAIFTNL